MDTARLLELYKPTPINNDTLLPYEWPGSYFIDEQEIEAVSNVLKRRSPFRFYGHTNEESYSTRLERAYCQKLGRKYAFSKP